MGEQLLIAEGGGGDDWGVACGDTVPLCGESTNPREKPEPGVPPVSPGNELKKFGDATKNTVC